MIWSLLVLLCVISSSTSAIRHHRLDSLLRTSHTHTHTSILATDVDVNIDAKINTNTNTAFAVSMKVGGIEDDRQNIFPAYKEPVIPQQNPYPENMQNKFTKEEYAKFLKQDEEANIKYERPKQGEDDLMKFEKLLDANIKKIKSVQDMYKIKKDEKEPKKGLLLSELHSSLAFSQADTITHAISDSLASDSQVDTAVDTSVSVGVHVGAAGDAVSLVVGGEEFAGVGAPLTRNGNSNRAFHGRSTVANALVYTIDNTGPWLGANQVRIMYTSGGVGVNQVLVFAGAVSNAHNLPADVDTFTLRHETIGGVLSHTYQVTMTGYNPVTVGLEIEDNHAVVKCCHTNVNDPNCANLAYKQEVVRSRVNPATNLPYLMFHLETPGGKSAILEYVTGPVPVHRTGAAVTAEAADINLALSHLLRVMEFNLNEHGGYCQTHGGANDVNNWIPLDIIIQRFNTAIQNDAANFQTNYQNYQLSLPSAGTFATNLNAWRFRIFQNLYRWRIRCAHALVFIDLQANIMMPLTAFGAMKAAGGGAPNWAGGVAAQNFLIDMFPDNVADEYQYVHSYVRRAQWVAHQLVTGAGPVIPGAIPAWQLAQFKGWLAALLMTAMHYAQRDCEVARTGAALSATDSKNHHVNLIKACLEDGARYFPNALTDVFVTWWTNGGGGGPAARIAGILALLTQVGGGAVGNYNAVGGGNGAHCIIVAPHLTAAAHFAHQFTANMQLFWPPAFTRNVAWQSRYGVTETNANQGTAGVITSNNYPGPPWQCFTAVANPSTKSPGRNINWGQTALLIESRHQASPINAGLMPTDQIGVGVTNVFPAYDAIRRIADSV